MGLPSIAVSEIADRYEGELLTDFREKFVQTKVSDAIALIQDECPAAATRLAAGTLSIDTYHRVVSDVVLRVLRNPSGLRTENEGGYGIGLSPTVASGDLWLTKRDLERLTGGGAARVPGTVSIGLDTGWG